MVQLSILIHLFIKFFNNFFTEIEQVKRLSLECESLVSNDAEAAAKEPTELFTKNTGLCEHESGCIGADSCPVLEG